MIRGCSGVGAAATDDSERYAVECEHSMFAIESFSLFAQAGPAARHIMEPRVRIGIIQVLRPALVYTVCRVDPRLQHFQRRQPTILSPAQDPPPNACLMLVCRMWVGGVRNRVQSRAAPYQQVPDARRVSVGGARQAFPDAAADETVGIENRRYLEAIHGDVHEGQEI